MSRARELAKAGGVQQRIVGVSSFVGVSTFAADVEMYQDLTVAGNLNVTGDLSFDETTATNQKITGVTTTTDLIVTQNVNVSGMQTVGAGASTTALDVRGHIIPDANDTYDLGAPNKVWRDVYIGPGSLYVNGQKVLQEDSSNIIVSCDENQNLVFQTSGSGDLELDPTGSGIVQVKGTLQIEDGTNITNSAGNPVTFGSPVASNSVTSRSANSNLALSGNGNGNVVVNDNLTVNGSLTVDGGNLDINTNGITVTTVSASGVTTSTGGFIGDVTGDVTGNVTGNLTGNVTSTGANSFGSAAISGNTTIGAGLTVSGNMVVSGNFTVDGTQTVINSTTLSVDDKTIEMGSVDTPTDTTANAGGIILKGAEDHTILWYNDNNHWESSEHFNLLPTKEYQIADTSVLNATTLGSAVVNSSLTSVGTLAGLTVSGNIMPNANGTLDIGSSGTRFANIYSSDLDLSNEAKGPNSVDGTWGSYLVEEGEDNLYITNRRSGKKFRFMLEEV